jgi:membrane protein YdbS with pleckstrin-like domain
MAAQPDQSVDRNTQHIPHSIHLLPGEKLVITIPCSIVLFYSGQVLRGVGLFLVLLFAVAFYRPDLWWIEIIAAVMVLALLVMMLARFIHYRYNICILTNRRIINIERSRLLIQEKRTETEYDNIREVNVNVTTLFERLFRIGTVYIETLSTSPGICLSSVDHPFDIQEKIYLLRDGFR